MGGGGWGTGSSENKAKLAQLGLELGLSLAIENTLEIKLQNFPSGLFPRIHVLPACTKFTCHY